MSTPLTTLPPRESLRHRMHGSDQQHHLTLTRFGSSQTFPLRHYGIYLVLSGAVRFQVDHQRFTASAGQMMLINAHQTVQVSVDEAHELLCLHLSAGQLAAALAQRVPGPDQADLAACLQPDGTPELCEQVYEAPQHALGRYLLHLAELLRERDVELPDDLGTIGTHATHLLLDHQVEAYQQLLQLTSAKLSTKRELYRRLCLARLHMHSHLDTALDLDTLAQVACLSKYHFIRLFKEAFGETPRQYLIARRLERASNLLIHSRKTFHEICQEVGLKDSSSFGRLFKRNFGATPHLYRQMHAQG